MQDLIRSWTPTLKNDEMKVRATLEFAYGGDSIR
jgi:hypothetical protein